MLKHLFFGGTEFEIGRVTSFIHLITGHNFSAVLRRSLQGLIDLSYVRVKSNTLRQCCLYIFTDIHKFY